jgi:uncharacterized protein (DUF1501 family)
MAARSSLVVGRRQVLQAGVAGVLGWAFSPVVQKVLAAESPARKAKQCVIVWLNGGPSHLDTFDPHPGVDTGGPFKTVETSVPGIHLSEHLPKLAKQMHLSTVVRSLTSEEPDHDRGYYYLHTGNRPQPTVEHPALGAVLAREWAADDKELPAFVTLGFSTRGGGAGFLGAEYAPYIVGDMGNPIQNVTPPENVTLARRERRLAGLQAFDASFVGKLSQPVASDHVRLTAKALKLMQGEGPAAFDVSQESQETRDLYGATADDAIFQRSCLVARRLLEKGVRLVEVVLDGWDTHADNFTAVQALSAQLDPGLSGLIADLEQRGMLDETMVICMGEFGRTPVINGQTGRDHWSDAFAAFLAGGGIGRGRAVGKSDDKGEKVAELPISIPELYATLLACSGIDSMKQFRTPEGRPIRLVDAAGPVKELMG